VSARTKPVLLVSDIHLGATPPDHRRAFGAWLDFAAAEASSLIINGDLFDFWFEYHWGITRGHDDILARLKEIVDSGLPITLMGGNHDWWGGRYLTEEIGLEFLRAPVTRDIGGHRTFLAHGDGLGAGDWGYLALKAVIRSPITRFAFATLPIDVGDRVAGGVSRTEDRWDEWSERQQARSDALETWAVQRLAEEPELDLVVLGHTHGPMLREPEPGRYYVNSGDWVFHQTYVTLQEGEPPRLDDWRERS
jgi:UDP-2,3-diacylglucosamine hydrolase